MIYNTSQNSITLPLLKGNNKLKVTTDRECQGVVEKLISLSDEIIIYPNPFENTLNLSLGNDNSKKAGIEIRNMEGKLVFARQYVNEYGRVQLDLSNLNSGFYLLKLSLDNSESTYKILKK